MRQDNPYGVTQRMVRRRCQCCHIDYETTELLEPIQCEHCRTHRPAGEPQEQVACYREHAVRYREIEKRAHGLVEQAMRERTQAEEARRDSLRQVAEALKSRNHYRGMYFAVMKLHEVGVDGVCACGEAPCPEREVADQAAFNLHRRYET